MASIWGLACAAVGHQRSRAQVRRYGEERISRCRTCGARMIRTGPGDWRLATDSEDDLLMRGETLPDQDAQAAA